MYVQHQFKWDMFDCLALCKCKLSAMHNPLIDLLVKIPKGVEVCVFKQKETASSVREELPICDQQFHLSRTKMAFEGLDEKTETWRDGTLVDITEDRYKLKWTDDKGEPGESWTSTIRRHVLQTHGRWGNDEDGTLSRSAADNHLNHEVK